MGSLSRGCYFVSVPGAGEHLHKLCPEGKVIKTSGMFSKAQSCPNRSDTRIYLEYLLLVKIPILTPEFLNQNGSCRGGVRIFIILWDLANLGNLASLRLLSQWLYRLFFTRALWGRSEAVRPHVRSRGALQVRQ